MWRARTAFALASVFLLAAALPAAAARPPLPLPPLAWDVQRWCGGGYYPYK
jgi:hypothetical protein